MSSSIINGLMFYTSKTINNYSNNYFVSGYITGVITSPIINIFELYKVRRQIGKPVKKIFLRPFFFCSNSADFPMKSLLLFSLTAQPSPASRGV